MSLEKNRIDKVTTKTGDDGMTSFPGKGRISKAEPVIKVLAGLDVVIAQIGALKINLHRIPDKSKIYYVNDNVGTAMGTKPNPWFDKLGIAQNNIMNICGELSSDKIIVNEKNLEELECWMLEINKYLSPCRDFVIPGYTRNESQCHIIRTEIRRAETELAVIVDEMRNPISYKYINRLSDFFFILARTFTKSEEKYWKH